MNDTDAGKDLKNHLLEDWKTAHNIWAHVRAYGDANWGGSGSSHAILSATHSDSTAAAVVRGDLMTGQGATPKWQRLALGANGKVLKSDGTDVVWGDSTGGATTFLALTDTPSSYNGAFQLVRINSANNALEFSSQFYSYAESNWNNPILADTFSATASHYSYLLMRRARGTYASMADVQAGDYVGFFSAQARVNGAYQYAGYAGWQVSSVGATYPVATYTINVGDGSTGTVTAATFTHQYLNLGSLYGRALYWQSTDGSISNVISHATSGYTWGVVGTLSNHSLQIWTNSLPRMWIAQDGGYIQVNPNLGLGGSSFGSSATYTLGLWTGNPPGSSPADMVQLYSQDFAAGNAVPTFRTENGTVIQLNQSLVTTALVQFSGINIERSAANPYLGFRNSSAADRKETYFQLDLANSKVIWDSLQQTVDFWPIEITAKRVHMILNSGLFYIQGNSDPGLLLSPSTGATKIAQIHQSGDSLYFADYGVANRTKLDLTSGDFTMLSGHLMVETDTKRLMVGTGHDGSFYHDGTNTYLQNDTGNLHIWEGPNAYTILSINSVEVGQFSSTGLRVTGNIKAYSTAAAHFEGMTIHKNAAWSSYQNYISWRDSSGITGGFGQDFSNPVCRFVWHSLYNNAYKGTADISMILYPDHLTLYGYSEILSDAATSFKAYTYNAGATTYSSFQTYRARGTQASPANLSVSDLTGAIIFNGRINGAFANCGGMVGVLANVISNQPTGSISFYLPDQGTEYLAADIRYDRSFFRGYLELTEASAPATPSSGYGRLVLQTDGKLWLINDGGVYYDLTLGAAHNLLSTTHSDSAAGSAVLGDLIYANATPAWTKLSGNITTTKKWLTQTGNGAISAAPTWDTIAQANVSGLTTSDSPQFTKLSLGAASPSDAILNVAGTIDAGAADAYGLYVRPTLHTNTTQGTIGVGINPVHNAATGESIGYAYGLWIGLQSKTGTGTVDLAVGAYINSPTFGTTNRSLYVGGAAEALFNPFVTFNSYLQLAEISAPSTPASGYARLYVKSDGKVYLLNDGATEYDLTAGASAVPTSRTISTTSPLSGGGDLTTNRTFSIGGLSSLGTGNYVVGVNSGGTGWEYKQMIQTSNRVTVTHGANSITFSGPQDIHTAATPQFASLGLGVAASAAMGINLQSVTTGIGIAINVATHHDPSAAAQTIKGIYTGITVDATTYGISAAYGLQVDAIQKAGANSVTTCIGLYLNEQTIGTANYAMWVNGGTSYFNGPVTLSATAGATFNAQAQFELALYQKEISKPANPSSGYGKLYPKSDGKLYYLNSAGTEVDLTLGGTVAAHGFLDSTYHSNTLTGTPVLGDIIHANTTPAWAKLAGNTTTTKKFLTQTGSGSVSAVPVWDTILQSNVSGLTTASTPQFAGLSLGEAWETDSIVNVSGTLNGGAEDINAIAVEATLAPTSSYGAMGIVVNPVIATGASNTVSYVYGIWIGQMSSTGTGSITDATSLYVNSPNIGTTKYSLRVTGTALATFAPAVRYSSYLEIAEQSAPSTPSSGYARLYAKTDGKPYWLDDAGTETSLIGASGSGKSKSQEFTSDGTWTQPTGVTLVWVTGVGGGGGGEAGTTSTRGGGAGGTGEYWYRYPVVVSGNVTVTLGTAGTAGSGSSGANGGNGGSTTFGALLTMLAGGGGGIGGVGYGGNGGGALGTTGAVSAGASPTGKGGHYFPGASGGGGTAGTGTGYTGGAQMRFAGGAGGNSTYGGGGGGSSFYGTGGTGGTSGVAGAAPAAGSYGAGGGGGYGGATYTNGGAGLKGYCFVEWVE